MFPGNQIMHLSVILQVVNDAWQPGCLARAQQVRAELEH